MWASGIIAVMVSLECLEMGMTTLSKAAMRRGMNNFVFVVYSNAIAFLFLLPSTFVFHRIRPCPQLTFSIVSRIFILAFLSYSAQICICMGIEYSSPTLASAMVALVPGFTFIFASVTRMEKLEFKLKSSLAKSIGAIISVVGAFIVTFYKGPEILLSHESPSEVLPLISPLPQSNWIIGGFLLAIASVMVASSCIVQTWIVMDYPAGLMISLNACFFVTIQSVIVALIAERDLNVWKLGLDMQLVTIGYYGILVLAIKGVVITWVLHKKGPVFVTMFKPLGMIIAFVLEVIFLGDCLHFGSIIGAAIIALGFYSVMWGKAQEMNILEQSEVPDSDSPTDKSCLLEHNNMGV
ncbi:WAT1-related protein At3g28050-like [Cornus florida]|uniref:WAT1-related protein At3g28050-like n=1 Tax=Cornus florida TaxID=4283 RepID=UPI0028A278D2|nr:WAT1-related protein At3g28050-like [Cornus florida]